MKKIPDNEVLQYFKADQGELLMIFGAIGQGKTTLATSMVLEDLQRGQVVYTTWKIDWSGYDQRDSLWVSILNVIFFRKPYIKFDKTNWRYLDVFQDDIWDKLEKLNNCRIYFDDVIVELFDSYEKTNFAKKKRRFAFTTRHFDRTIVLVTQRPSQVQVALRSQVNRFYMCKKKLSWPFLLLSRYEYQEMSDENVDLTKDPVSKKTYIPTRKILNAFNTKNMRTDVAPIYPTIDVFLLTFTERFVNLYLVIYRVISLIFAKTINRFRKNKAVNNNSQGDKNVGANQKILERLNTIENGGEPPVDQSELPF